MIYEGVAPTPETLPGSPPGGFDNGHPVYTHEDIILNPPLPIDQIGQHGGGIFELSQTFDQIKKHNVLPDDVKTEILRKRQDIYDIADKTLRQRKRASVTHDNDYIKSLSPRERQRVIQYLEDTVWYRDTVFELIEVDLHQRKIWNEGVEKMQAADKRLKALKSRYKKVCKERDALKKA